jgi:hypothetical protein
VVNYCRECGKDAPHVYHNLTNWKCNICLAIKYLDGSMGTKVEPKFEMHSEYYEDDEDDNYPFYDD